MKIRHVPDCTVIQLTDGRIGWKGVNSQATKKNLIIFANGSGVELQPNDEVKVIKFPAQIAREYVAALPAQPDPSENSEREPSTMETDVSAF